MGYEVEIGGKTYDVDAPDEKTAVQKAQAAHVAQHPWNQFNAAARAGQPVELGKEYPGAGYIPTKGEAAADLGLAGATIAAGPLATAATGSAVVAPALARAGVQALPPLFTKTGMDALMESGKRAGVSLGIDGLMSLLGLPGAARNYMANRNAPPVAVHQAANPTIPAGPGGGPTPPIVFNRVNSGSTPTVTGGGAVGVTPTQVTVQPPSSGVWSGGNAHPAAILQESMPNAPRPPLVGEGGRAAAVAGAEQEPDKSFVGLAALYNLLGDYAKKAMGGLGTAIHGAM